jgi:hypothetical protein
MSQAQLAAGPDRLPWLADEPAPRPAREPRTNPAIAAGVLVATAAAAFWIGASGWFEPAPPPPAATVTLPEPRAPQAASQRREAVAPDQPEVTLAPLPDVRLAPAREVRIAPPRPVRTERGVALKVQPSARPRTRVAAPAPAPSVARPATLTPWPPRVTAGAYGRLVQVGAFGTRLQAKRGWWAMVRSYPAMAHLPAVVVGARNSKGRRFYRFQVGTTSQAHSEVLCQRMRKIRFSCAVIGLPWKPRGVER